MYIQPFPLRGLSIFLFSVVLVVKALPASHFNPIRDDSTWIFSRKEKSSEGFDPDLLDSDVSTASSNFYSPEASPDLFAFASTQPDSASSLFHDFDQPGIDYRSSGDYDIFSDLGPASEPMDYSLPDDTIALNDASFDQPNPAGSPDLFMDDKSGGSGSSQSYAFSLLPFDEQSLSDGLSIPNSVNSVENSIFGDDALPGDDTVLNPADPVKASSISDDDLLFDYGDQDSDMFLSGDSSTTDTMNSPEDIGSSVLDNTEGTLVASAANIQVEGSTVPPKCSPNKTPACCLSSKTPPIALPGYRGGCQSCTCCVV